jgi:FkbM family methyltransferase
VTVRTRLAPLYVHKEDEFLTPALAAHRIWEPGEAAVIEKHLRAGMTFLDICRRRNVLRRGAAPTPTPATTASPRPMSDARVKVKMVALDDLDELRTPLDVVKIDVQGAEPQVIRGMQRLLPESPAVTLFVEFWPYGMRFLGLDERSTLDYYRSLGFSLRAQHPEELMIRDLSDDEIIAHCRGKDGWA